MPAREITKIVQDRASMALELWAQIEVLNSIMGELAEGIKTARAAGRMFQQMEVFLKTFEEELNQLAASVEGITGVVPSVVATLGDLAGKFKANANDPDRIGQLADQLDGAKVALANAIANPGIGDGAAAPAEEPPPPPAEPTADPQPPSPSAEIF